MKKHVRVKVSGLIKYFYFFKKDFKIFKWLLTSRGFTKEFQVLNGLNFEVTDGEIVGILGANGAGKSTLLKIIAGVYHPTAGTTYVDGKISSLLELGAGFNNILTGRENIYFKGNILGMKKHEIDDVIDDIIEFADIGEYIDMPLLSYSSGMAARLGFALAVNVNPDILIIDEVFAVGDRDFQQKSKQKTMEFFENGKTILFVSHSEDLIRTFCTRVLYLSDGFIAFDGDVEEGIEFYHHTIREKSKSEAMLLDKFELKKTSVTFDFEIGRTYQNQVFKPIDLSKIELLVAKYNVEKNIMHDYNFVDVKFSVLDDTHIRLEMKIKDILNQGFISFKFDDHLNNTYGLSYNFFEDDTVFSDKYRLRIRKRAGRLAIDLTDNFS
ncbi:MAG: ABC transporter ATP-binding protein [Bacilli bacterium]